jgi:quinolinate synthase
MLSLRLIDQVLKAGAKYGPNFTTGVQDVHMPRDKLQDYATQFRGFANPKQRLAELVSFGKQLPSLPQAERTRANQVMGCTAQVWLTASWAGDGTVAIAADSDSSISRGLAAVLLGTFAGCTPAEIDAVTLDELDQLGLGAALAAPSRTNAFRNMFCALQKRVRALNGELPAFPSLLITADDLVPQGVFAEAQAQFLQPSTDQVQRLARVLEQKRIGVVAHFYMDPEVQGVLTSAAEQWPHIAISGAQLFMCI